MLEDSKYYARDQNLNFNCVIFCCNRRLKLFSHPTQINCRTLQYKHIGIAVSFGLVCPKFSENVYQKYRLIAIDLLGFGKSPKPRDCLYTLKDHVEMIEKSVIQPLELGTFHLVAHSMGCLIALALAAEYPNCVKSITLVAPVSTSHQNIILMLSSFKN